MTRAALTLVGLASALSFRKPSSPWLLDGELKDIRSVDCLKQKYAGDEHCVHRVLRPAVSETRRGDWQIGKFPMYTDSECGQKVNKTNDVESINGPEDIQPLCDPDGLLTGAELREVEDALYQAWTSTRVKCGVTGTDRPPEDVAFRIGVALLRALPMAEQEADTLELFGQSVLQMWGLQDPELQARKEGIGEMCPDSALLVFVEEPNEAVSVASGNCDHICMARGGDYVVTAAHLGWKTGLKEAVLRAIQETKRVVETQPSLLDYKSNFTHEPADAEFRAWLAQEDTIVSAQRAIVACIFATCGCAVFAMVYYALRFAVYRFWWDYTKHFEPGYVDDRLRMHRGRTPLEL